MNTVAAIPPAKSAVRIESVDLFRGLIMVVMAIDHVRDYFHFNAVQGMDPLNLAQTTPAIFLTRWITHFCAPNFSFLAGVGVFLAVLRGKSKRELSWFLVTRGLWLMFLELTVLTWFGWGFEITLHSYILATLWSLGWSMIVLAGLIHLPVGWIAAFSLTLILGHNAFDGFQPSSWGNLAWLWQLLHVTGSSNTASGFQIWYFYPLIPWIGVMAAGYCAGAVYQLDATTRRRWLLGGGLTLIGAFIVLRFTNAYGNLTPWVAQSSAGLTALSFLDCTKYPPSLCYLLMTLGPGLVLLALFEGRVPKWLSPLLVFGRVPFFYYLLHIPLIHALAWILYRFQFGRADFSPLGGTPPPAAGLGLPAMYAVWIGVVAILYPACRWFADLKRRRKDAWLSYF